MPSASVHGAQPADAARAIPYRQIFHFMSATPFGNKSGPATADFEVLPPEGKGVTDASNRPGGIPRTKEEAISRLIAYLMDNLVKIPGTKARVGINPFLDMLPLVGDGAAMLISAATILEGARRGVPKPVLARMGMNILLNGLVGTIPGVGEVFAFWFKPSSRNYQLLVQHTPAPGTPKVKATAREWAVVLAMVAGLLIVLGAFIGIGFYVILWLLHGLEHLFGR